MAVRVLVCPVVTCRLVLICACAFSGWSDVVRLDFGLCLSIRAYDTILPSIGSYVVI